MSKCAFFWKENKGWTIRCMPHALTWDRPRSESVSRGVFYSFAHPHLEQGGLVTTVQVTGSAGLLAMLQKTERAR